MTVGDQPILAQRGATFEVALPTNAGTGYLWSLVACPAQLKLVGEVSRTPPQTSPPIAGGPSEQVFQLAAQAAGTFTLTFALKRAWEQQPLDTRSISVRVAP